MFLRMDRPDEQKLEEREGAMDTCIALRTMLVKDGVAYLQAGGGIVWDSVPEEEWLETMNKLQANISCIATAEERYAGLEGDHRPRMNGVVKSREKQPSICHGIGEEAQRSDSVHKQERCAGEDGKIHVDFAAG